MPGPVTPPSLGRVLLASSDPLVRAGLAGLLSDAGVTLTVGPGQPVDVALWDTARAPPPPLGPGAPPLPPPGGAAPVLALVVDEADARAALARGAAGAVLRSVDGATLQAALGALERGLLAVERTFTTLRPAPEPVAVSSREGFTPREREVLAL